MNDTNLSQPETPPQVTLMKGQIILNPGISKTNFACFNFYQLVIIFAFVSVDVLQPNLLSDPNYYNVSQADLTDQNTTVLLWDMIVKISVAPFYGLLCDKYGRKPLLIYGLISMCLGILMFPFMGVIYPNFIIARALFANGAMACVIIPLLADYVDYEAKGRAAGLLVIMSAIGGVSSSSYCLTYTVGLDMTMKYVILGTSILVMGLGSALGLKGGQYHKALFVDEKMVKAQHEADAELDPVGQGLLQPVEKKLEIKKDPMCPARKLLVGFEQAKNPWVLLGYIVSFLARGDSGLLSFCLVIWAKYFYPNNEENQEAATNLAYELSGIAYMVLTVAGVFFGFYSDKYSKYKILIIIYLNVIVGTMLLSISGGPNDPLAYIAMIFIGVGVAGLDCSALQLVNKYADPKYRGAVNALSSLFSVIGLVTISIGGGYLMGSHIEAAYLLYMGCAVIALITTMALYKMNRSMRKL